ncbi:hypothetical protein POTOM_047460 [Populus tomentosa]|uniref:Rhodopsin n=1 Tax=Populus tomentosa TaxID=118781 RepID=A0A8X8C9M2_POPTO|nr:hypothetical protein POTOM_047460 [Populus tomentosa]
MSYYDQHQPPVSVPPQQGYPKDAYPPPGYPVQGYPQGYPPQGYAPQGYAPQYAAPPPRQETGFLEGCKRSAKKDASLLKISLMHWREQGQGSDLSYRHKSNNTVYNATTVDIVSKII